MDLAIRILSNGRGLNVRLTTCVSLLQRVLNFRSPAAWISCFRPAIMAFGEMSPLALFNQTVS